MVGSRGGRRGNDIRERVPQPGLLKVRAPRRGSALGGALSQGWPSLASGTVVEEEGQKTLDGRSVSFGKMGIITQGCCDNLVECRPRAQKADSAS